MKTSPIRYALFAASAILLLAGCVKMPKPGTQNPEEPDNPDSPPPTEYLYPFGDEPGQITAEIALSFGPGTDLSAAHIEIPPLKYNKSLLLLLTQDDCKQAAFSTTWAAINGRPLSDTYFYNAPHLRGGDMPPDTYSFGKALGSTDGTGREVRFSFTTAISPEWDYMDDKAVVRPGFTENYYRFFMRAGLMWDDVTEMLNYGVGIAFHDVNTLSVDVPDSIRAHFVSSQRIVLDRLAGRGCKMLIEPNGNKAYVAAAEGYDPIQTIFLQSGGEKLRPFAVNGDLLRTRIERGLWLPAAIPAVIEAQMARPVEEREAVNIGVHGTDRFWSEMLLWLNNTYGRDGEDCLWMPAAEEYFEYNYLRHHAVVNARVTENTLTLTVEMPGGLYFYYPSLTINLLGVDPGACTAVGGGETVTGLSWGRGRTADDGAEALMVNFDCRHALVAHAEHFVAVYEADPSAANRADARYFVAMLKDSDCKERLLKRIK